MKEIITISLSKKQISFILQCLNAVSIQGIDNQKELVNIANILGENLNVKSDLSD